MGPYLFRAARQLDIDQMAAAENRILTFAARMRALTHACDRVEKEFERMGRWNVKHPLECQAMAEIVLSHTWLYDVFCRKARDREGTGFESLKQGYLCLLNDMAAYVQARCDEEGKDAPLLLVETEGRP